ncbi:hypothetical protein [Brevundimonas sp. TWP1-2-1b1]|uniref:hypothetical protein n=1 Tax=unclassified Brevundimonas TaxID=2622653 RepID=UPI003CF5BD4F
MQVQPDARQPPLSTFIQSPQNHHFSGLWNYQPKCDSRRIEIDRQSTCYHKLIVTEKSPRSSEPTTVDAEPRWSGLRSVGFIVGLSVLLWILIATGVYLAVRAIL